MLDAGCGHGAWSELLSGRGFRVVAMDNSFGLTRAAISRHPKLLPLGPSQFDPRCTSPVFSLSQKLGHLPDTLRETRLYGRWLE